MSLTKAVICFSITAMYLVFVMAVQVSPSVMTGQLINDLHLSTYQLGLISGIFFYSYALMQIPAGMLFDKFHPKYIVVGAILLCSFGVLGFAFSHNLTLSYGMRLLMGLSSTVAFIATLVVSSDLFKAKYFAVLAGLTYTFAASGAMFGQLILSKFTALVGWRDMLLIFAAFGFCLALFAWFNLHYPKKTVEEHQKVKLSQAFALVFKNPQTWYVALYSCLLWAPMAGFASLWGIPFLVQAEHITPTESASLMSFMWIGLAIMSPGISWISTRLGQRKLPIVSSAMIGGIGFTAILMFHLPVWEVALMLFVAGCACAGQGVCFSIVKENNPKAVEATAIAVNNMAVVISGAIFQPLIGRLLEVHTTHYPIFGMVLTPFQFGLMAILLAYALGAVIAIFFIKETYGKEFISV